MIKLSFNGALSTVGCSAVLVETNTERILLDYGTKIQEISQKFPLPVEGKLNAILLSHPHLDHCGGLGIFAKHNIPIYAMNVSKPIVKLLLIDSIKISREEGVYLPFTKADVKKIVNNFSSVNYRKPFRIGKTKVVCYDAGHIPGSMMILLESNGKKLLYTGDFNTNNTRLLRGADKNLPEVDILITESTYSDRNHPSRKEQEKELIKIVDETLAVDGICLIPAFAVARSQEILLVLYKHGIDYPIYMDGMAKKATTIINQYKDLLKEPDSLDEALKKVEYATERKRKKIMKEPCVVITTSGMLTGGPVVNYIKKLYDRRNCSLVLVGYQLEGTPGKTLLETGRFINDEVNLDMKMFVKRLDFSSHLGRDDLFKFIERVGPKKVFCVHGDHTEEFAEELRERGIDATAPLANNRIFVI